MINTENQKLVHKYWLKIKDNLSLHYDVGKQRSNDLKYLVLLFNIYLDDVGPSH